MSHHLESQEDPTPIPPDLYSEYEERPFRTCTRCGEGLADFEGGYQVSKAFKNGECVFEYALCHHCSVRMMEEFSDESKRRMGDFMEKHARADRGLAVCALCGISRSHATVRDFVICGICDRAHLMQGTMLCGECGDHVQELISKKTRNTWRRFVNDNFPGPPADELPEPEEWRQPLPALLGKG